MDGRGHGPAWAGQGRLSKGQRFGSTTPSCPSATSTSSPCIYLLFLLLLLFIPRPPGVQIVCVNSLNPKTLYFFLPFAFLLLLPPFLPSLDPPANELQLTPPAPAHPPSAHPVRPTACLPLHFCLHQSTFMRPLFHCAKNDRKQRCRSAPLTALRSPARPPARRIQFHTFEFPPHEAAAAVAGRRTCVNDLAICHSPIDTKRLHKFRFGAPSFALPPPPLRSAL